MSFAGGWKKTVRRVIGIAVFLIIGVMFFLRLSEVMRRKTGKYTDMIHSFYELEKDSLDVLVLGSSHGFCTFQPNLLWDKYGATSYVMCSQRQTIAQSYYLLQEALKYQKPKVLVLEAYYFFFDYEHTGDAALRYAFDGMRFSKLKYDMIEDFREGMSWKEKMSYYIPFIKYHPRWSELSNEDFHSKLWTKGAVFEDKIEEVIEPVCPTEGGKVSSVFFDYFERVLDLCEKNGIKVVVYAAPYTYKNDTEENRNDFARKVGKYITLEPYMEEKGIPFFFYQKNGGIDIDFSMDFQDYSHMNIYGAVKITNALSDFLHENYSLPDHRGDENYRSWEEDCQIFREKAGKLGLL